MKSKKKETTEGIDQLNQESTRTLGENENCMYLGLMKAVNIKQAERKEK